MANALQELAWRYLEKLYELSEGGLHPEVDAYLVQSELELSHEKARPVIHYLTEKDLISWKCAVPNVRITTRGVDLMQDSYEQKETLVLKKIYDLSQQNAAKPVFLHQLESEFEMGWQEVTGFCKGLDEQGFINYPPDVDSYLYITRRGIDAIQSLGKPKQSTGGDSYTLNVQNLNGGVQQGPGGTQNIQIYYQPLSEILPQLAAFVEAVRKVDFADKDDVMRDLDVALEVAKHNPNAIASDGTWKRIQAKLTAAKTTMEIAGLAYASYPHWPAIWDFFTQAIK